MIFWGVVTIILGLRSETYLEQSMRLNGEDSANRILEFIHKYGFVSSNSLLLKEIEFTENGLDQGVNSSGEEWCLCKMSWLQRLALLPPGCTDASQSSSQPCEFSQGAMSSLQREESFPHVLT